MHDLQNLVRMSGKDLLSAVLLVETLFYLLKQLDFFLLFQAT